MKLKLSTLILLFVALSLGGFVYFFEVRGAPQREAAQAENQQLFDFTEDQVRAFTVRTRQQVLFFRKSNAGPSTPGQPIWQMQSPNQAPANDASVAYLLNLLATGTSDRTLTAPASQRSEFGLDQPLAIIDLKLNNNQTHQLVLGKANFNRSFLYAQADPSLASQVQVLLVSTDFENAVNRPLSEWQSQDKRPSQTKPK